jgi:hypothetical protein
LSQFVFKWSYKSKVNNVFVWENKEFLAELIKPTFLLHRCQVP